MDETNRDFIVGLLVDLQIVLEDVEGGDDFQDDINEAILILEAAKTNV